MASSKSVCFKSKSLGGPNKTPTTFMPRSLTRLTVSLVKVLLDPIHHWISQALNAHCEACNRYASVNLYRLALQYGREAPFVKSESPIWLKCSLCGTGPCDYKLAPPVPG